MSQGRGGRLGSRPHTANTAALVEVALPIMRSDATAAHETPRQTSGNSWPKWRRERQYIAISISTSLSTSYLLMQSGWHSVRSLHNRDESYIRGSVPRLTTNSRCAQRLVPSGFTSWWYLRPRGGTRMHGSRQAAGAGGQAGRQAGWQAGRQTGRQADRQAGRQADRQAGRQTKLACQTTRPGAHLASAEIERNLNFGNAFVDSSAT
jgi:hypothetical protein